MPATKRRSRRSRPSAAASPVYEAPPVIHQGRPMPVWRWRTFPVFFAFSLGGFIGMYAGFLAGASDSETFVLAVFLTFALMLGLAFSRISSRWFISKNWVKPKPKKK